MLDRVNGVVEYLKEPLSFFFLVGVGLHLDLELVLEVPVLLLFFVDGGFDALLLSNDLFLLEQVLPILLDLQLKLLVGLHQLLPLSLDLCQQSFVLVLFLVQGLDLVFELLDEVEVGGRDLCVIGLNVRVLFGVLGRQLLYLVVLLVLQLLYEVLPEVLHLVPHLLHLEVVLLLEVSGLPLELLPQLSLPLVVLGLEGEEVVFLAELLLFEGDVERPDVCFERPFFDPMLIFELLEGDLDILPKLALLVLVDKHDMLDSGWGGYYFCL